MSDSPKRDWGKLTVAELKEELNARGLAVSGLKKDLIARLQQSSEEVEDMGHEEPQEITETNVIDTVGFEDNEGNEQEQLSEMSKGQTAEESEVPSYEVKTEPKEEYVTVKKEILCETVTNENIQIEDNHVEEGNNIKQEMEEGETADQNEDEEEEVNMDDMVAVDETNDDDDDDEDNDGEKSDKAGDFSHLEDDLLDDKDNVNMEKLFKSDDELMPLPPGPMQKWVFNTYLSDRSKCVLYISQLSAKDVLCPTMVEWSNRAMFFCINHNRDGKGFAMLHFSSESECAEALEALRQNIGEEVTICHPDSDHESEIKKGITYNVDSSFSLRTRLLFVEDAPKDTTVEQISSIFADALLVLRLEHDERIFKWEEKDYSFPDDIIKKTFVLEFPSTEAATKLHKEEKEYEIDGNKITLKKISELEEDYKRYHARRLREARDKKWEILEKRKAEDIGEIILTDKDRLRLYKNIISLNKVKNALVKSAEKSYEDKVLDKETIIVKIYEITKKIDADTDRRLKEDINIPEQPRYMTKHTKEKYAELPHETRKKMQKEEQDVFETPKRGVTSDRRERERNMKRPTGNRPHDRDGRGRGRDGRRDDRRDHRGGMDRFRDRRSMNNSRRDRFNDRSVWRSPERMDAKRRRTDYMDDSRDRRRNPDVAAQLKGLTDVISYKMSEIERLAGGMKARERALEEAYGTMKRGSDHVDSYQTGGYSGPMSSGGNFMRSAMSSQSSGYGSYQSGSMSRSGVSNVERRRPGDVDDRFSRF